VTSLHLVCLRAAFAPTLEAITADLQEVAQQHGAADPRGAAQTAIRRHARELASLLSELRTEVAAEIPMEVE
jgi:hypothetical protein